MRKRAEWVGVLGIVCVCTVLSGMTLGVPFNLAAEIKRGSWRAMNEMAGKAGSDKKAQSLLLEGAFCRKTGFMFFDENAAEVLSRASWATPQRIKDAYRACPNGETLCMILGRMEEKATPLIPFLQEEVKKNDKDAELMAQARVVLANAGYERERNRSLICEAIKGTGCGREASLAMMTVTHSSWVGEEEVKAMIPLLEVKGDYETWSEKNEGAFAATIMLGQAGTKAHLATSAIVRLVALEEKNKESDYRGCWLMYKLVLARIDDKWADKHLDDFLRAVADGTRDHTESAFLWAARDIIDDTTLSKLIQRASWSDKQVAKGALNMLAIWGKEDRAAADAVKSALRENKDPKVDEAGIRALGTVGSESDIEFVEDMIEKPDPNDERDDLHLRGTLRTLQVVQTVRQKADGVEEVVHVCGDRPTSEHISPDVLKKAKEGFTSTGFRKITENGKETYHWLTLVSFDSKTAIVGELVRRGESKRWRWVKRYELARSKEVDDAAGITFLLVERSRVIGGVKYGMTQDELTATRGRHYKISSDCESNLRGLVYDDVVVWTTEFFDNVNYVVKVEEATQAMKDALKDKDYIDEKMEQNRRRMQELSRKRMESGQ